jgi:hypothetical protein
MSICRYCGQKTGWFKDAHEECVQRAAAGVNNLKACVVDAVLQGKKYGDIKDQIDGLILDSAIPKDEVLPAIKEAWSQGATSRSIAQPISDPELSAMSDLYRGAGLSPEEMRKTSGHLAMVLSFLIWTVLNDQIEPYKGPVSFNLQHGEVPVFGIANVLLTEERTTSSYVGGYSGASIRVASGLYYHLGGVRRHRVASTSLQEVDYGDFLMTTKAIYFGGTKHGVNFRLPYNQVIRFQPYSDAVGICKNSGKEKMFAPQHVAECGWFLFNILQALAAKESEVRR